MPVENLNVFEDDFWAINEKLNQVLKSTNCLSVMLIDKAGQLITTAGDISQLDTTSFSSLCAADFAATSQLAMLVGEKEFATLFHQGEKQNIYIASIEDRVMLAVVFDQRTTLGLVRVRVKQVVLELLETVEANDDVIKRCDELRRLGYRLALDDVTEVNDRVKALLPLVDVVKIDLMQIDWAALPDIVNALKPWPLSLVAEKVESKKHAERCMALGFQLFQGYYFAQPEIVSGKRAEPSEMTLLRLLALILGDAELAEIELEFKRHPHLVYNLMRIVNSAACGLPQKIDSLRQCIMILGRNQLQKWVQLLLYTLGRPGARLVSPLMLMAATRGKWMEALARGQRAGDVKYHDRAFMAGILSLLDALLGLQMSDVVSELNLADEVKSALLTRQGALGSLLLLIEKKEANDLSAVSCMLRDLPDFTPARFTTAELEAAAWANGLGRAA